MPDNLWQDLSFWRDAVFQPETDFEHEFQHRTLGLIRTKFARKADAGLLQFFGPFVPGQTRHPSFFFRTDSDIAQLAESVGVRYFLEYTPEAESYFLALDLAQRPLLGTADLAPLVDTISRALMRSWQELDRTAAGRRR
jgi:hypothetical protein